MDFDLTDDQRQLQEELRRLLTDRCTPEVRRGAQSLPGAVDRDLWRTLADTGVFALRVPESEGGVGLGLADATVVFEELGRAAVPGPLVWTSLAAGVIDGAASGETVAGGVDAGALAAGPVLVEHLEALDVLIVLDGRGARRIDVAGLPAEPVRRPLDPLTPVHVVAGLPDGEPIAGAESDRWRRDGLVLVAALQVGLGASAVSLATGYALERQQFGRAIGSFQALKHLLADAATQVEIARVAAQSAAVMIDEGSDAGSTARAVAAARVVAGRAAEVAGKMCVQVHGGMGYTWEVEAHLLLKRAMALDTVLGSLDSAIEVVAASI
jgi:alkylation response protein AidB-like acyl-CoA dehydrogenase